MEIFKGSFHFIFCLLLMVTSPSYGLAEVGGEVDYLALAQILVKDGHYQRAQKTIAKMSREERAENLALILSLEGMIALNNQRYNKALDLFEESLKAGLKSKEVHLYRAEALLQLDKYSEAEGELEKIEPQDKLKLPYFLIKAECLWQQQKKNEAWSLLTRAEEKNLSISVLVKKKFSYLLEEQLYLAATDLAYTLLNRGDNFQDVLAMASQLRVKKQNQASLGLLQVLQFQRPEKEMVALEMAQNYLAMGQAFSAALILEKAAKLNNSLAFEASEMLRQVGKSYRARFLNMTTTEPAKRLKQQLALFLEEDDYLSLKYMIPQLRKNELLQDQDIRYAVAYSLFRTGDFKKSEDLLNTIDKDGLFEKSIELKREIGNCQADKWACSETI